MKIIKDFKDWKVNEQIEMTLALVKVSRIEQEARLHDNIVSLLNIQAAFELESSQVYRAIACWCNKEGRPAATTYYMNAADEELKHYVKVYEYLFDKNSDGVVAQIPQVKNSYTNITDVLEASLKHEMEVSTRWTCIADAALELKDHDTYALAQWFLKEQIEEENKFRNLLEKVRMDMPDYEIEKLFQ